VVAIQSLVKSSDDGPPATFVIPRHDLAEGRVPLGTRVIGVQYRKLHVQRIDSTQLEADLDAGTWKLYDRRGIRGDEPDGLKVTLEDSLAINELATHDKAGFYTTNEQGESTLFFYEKE
jgi:hypothetical protein